MNSYNRVHLALFFLLSLTLAQAWATGTSPSGGSGSESGVFTSNIIDYNFTNIDREIRLRLQDKLGSKEKISDPDQIVFGPEFTFWVPKLDENGRPDPSGAGEDYPQKAIYEFVDYVVKQYVDTPDPELIAIYEHGEYWDADFFSKSGWHFNVVPDPGVIEATMAPMTVSDYIKHKNEIQKLVFDSASEIGYQPSHYGGGGHISISLSYFKKRPLLFRNFIVDLLNHGELFLGVFGFDTNNALSPLLVRRDTWRHISKELEILDQFRINSEKVENFAVAFSSLLHSSNDPYIAYWHDSATIHGIPVPRGKFHAIEFKRIFIRSPGRSPVPIGVSDRLEIRAVRAQASADVWVRQIRLIEKRIKYLETLQQPLPLDPIFQPNRFEHIPAELLEDKALNIPIDPQEALKAFHQYVTESGEKWEDHQDYLWPAWIVNREVEKFNRSLCSNLLERAQ